ncbi:hypothetical protein QVD17_10476 [Tagetes erecta]|uniref:Uncharacterized protein n=1 Tax=Tagetes erecta TaxID=13708 RepID=A0AAD8L177_TARER|nr:hypothetical protein QVD17_10476 [Tagetes erecta]
MDEADFFCKYLSKFFLLVKVWLALLLYSISLIHTPTCLQLAPSILLFPHLIYRNTILALHHLHLLLICSDDLW